MNDEKMPYVEPQMDVILLEARDIISTSVPPAKKDEDEGWGELKKL